MFFEIMYVSGQRNIKEISFDVISNILKIIHKQVIVIYSVNMKLPQEISV
jgi:hypothetical protein